MFHFLVTEPNERFQRRLEKSDAFVRAMVRLLNAAGVNFAVLGAEEKIQAREYAVFCRLRDALGQELPRLQAIAAAPRRGSTVKGSIDELFGARCARWQETSPRIGRPWTTPSTWWSPSARRESRCC